MLIIKHFHNNDLGAKINKLRTDSGANIEINRVTGVVSVSSFDLKYLFAFIHAYISVSSMYASNFEVHDHFILIISALILITQHTNATESTLLL